MAGLTAVALDIGAHERTLRRAVAQGLIRAERPSPRRLRLSAREREYLRTHWPLLAKIRSALRTEPNVRMAVLFGSLARGNEHRVSDVDILVDLEDEGAARRADIALRLAEALGRPVELVSLRDAEHSPTLLAAALRDGRPLVDRDGSWPRLLRRSPATARAAERERTALNRALADEYGLDLVL